MPRERTPGPGAYNLDVRPITPTSPSYTIAPRTPPNTAWEILPGPGSYNLKSFLNGPAYTIPAKCPIPDYEKKNIPGPGSYNLGSPNTTRLKEPAYTLAGSRRSRTSYYGPGPGSYTLPRVHGGPALTIPGKRSVPSTPKSPGPGAYTPSSRPSSPAYTMASRYSKKRPDTSPGPGAYYPKGLSQGPAYTIPGRWRKIDTNHTPGPGAYQLNLAAALKYQADPAYTISSRRNVVLDDPGPGPGSYSAPPSSRIHPAPAYTIGEKKFSRTDALSQIPGPGEYCIFGAKNEGPAYTFAGKGMAPHGAGTPGPGAYRPKDRFGGPAYTMCGKHFSLRKANETPGPGVYETYTRHVLTCAPRFSIGMRYRDKGKDISPGPGSYELRTSGNGPSYSICSGTQRFNYF